MKAQVTNRYTPQNTKQSAAAVRTCDEEPDPVNIMVFTNFNGMYPRSQASQNHSPLAVLELQLPAALASTTSGEDKHS